MAIKRWPTCGTKNRYPSRTVAIHAAIGASRRSGLPLRVYRCHRCAGGWHLTKMKTWKGMPAERVAGDTTRARNELDHRHGCPCGQGAWLGEGSESGFTA